MWVGSGVAAAVMAAVLGVGVGPALADSGDAGPAPQRFMFFSGVDAWRNGGFAHAGLIWAAAGLDQEGLVIKVTAGGGLYRYISAALGNAEVTGYKTDATAMAGWRFRRENIYLTAFAGLDWQRHKLTPDDITAGLRGSYTGLRGAVEFWYQPSTTTMVAADIAASTIGPSYSGRLAYGWWLFDKFYLGPEISGFTADGNYRQYRVGVHVTSMKFAMFSRTYLEWLNLEWSAGLGYATDSDNRSSPYVRLGILTRR